MYRNLHLNVLTRVGTGCLFLALLGGCSEPRKVITGTVTFRGQPLISGVVRIHGPGDHFTSVSIQPDGKFILTDVFAGDVRVTVLKDSGGRSMMPPSKAAMPPGQSAPPGQGGQAPPSEIFIPTKYQDPATSGLAYTIKPDMHVLDIKLE